MALVFPQILRAGAILEQVPRAPGRIIASKRRYEIRTPGFLGVAGFDADGLLNVNNRFRDGVVGAVAVGGLGLRTGDDGRASGGVTSVCNKDVNKELACSVRVRESGK